MELESAEKQHHFILVHGNCQGAWCWYRVATVLSSAGHRVTELDMAACGASPGLAEEVASFEEYSRPLLDAVAALPPGERAIIVGHSLGGLSLALAMERYPDKVAVAVFVSAATPAAGKPMALVLEQDLTLAKAMVRPSQWFLDDAVMENVLTAERYGAVRRVYVVVEDDATWSAKFQHRMASWNLGTKVRGLQGADHMPMFSKPRELFELLV